MSIVHNHIKLTHSAPAEMFASVLKRKPKIDDVSETYLKGSLLWSDAIYTFFSVWNGMKHRHLLQNVFEVYLTFYFG